MIGELGTKTLRDLFGGHISTAQVLQKIAAGMAACGVNVVIDPNCKVPYADIDAKKIVIPAQVKTERALLVVDWFVDHESGHIMFTPSIVTVINGWVKQSAMLDVLKKHGFNNFPDSLLLAAKGMLNLAEDARIEKLVMAQIPGTRKHFLAGPIACDLADIVGGMLEQAIEAQKENGLPEPPINPFWAGQMHVYHMLDGTHGRLPKHHVRTLLNPYTPEILDIAEEEFGDIQDVTSCTMYELAKRTDKAMARIMDIVLDNATTDEEEGEGDEQDGGGSGSADNPFQTNFSKKKGGKSQGQPMEPDDDQDSDDESDEGSEGSEGEEGDEEGTNEKGSGGDGSGKSKGESEEDESTESGEEGEDEGESGEDDGETSAPEPTEDSENDADGNTTPKEVPKQVEEWAKDAQADMAEIMRGAEGGQEPTGDSSGPRGTAGGEPACDHNASAAGMPDNYFNQMSAGVQSVLITSPDITKLRQNVSQQFQIYDDLIRSLMPPGLGAMSRKLVGRFRDAPGEAWVGKRINPRRMAQIKAGTAYGKKLYTRRNQTTDSKKGLSVMLMVDCSGSMASGVHGLQMKNRLANSKFAVAHAAARSMARLLQSINVPFSVGGFTTAESVTGGYSYGASRNCDLVHFIFKDFHEPWSTSEQNLLAMNTFAEYTFNGRHIYSNCNSDGESVLWAATQLLTREEETKVLIVLSDGLPAGGSSTLQSGFLKWAVKRISISGVRIGALGLGCDSVKHYYPVNEILDAFPAGSGEPETASLYLQEKMFSLVDKLMTREESL